MGSVEENFGGPGPDHCRRLWSRGPPFGGTGPIHHCRTGGPPIDEHGEDSDSDHRSNQDDLTDPTREIVLSIPFDSRTCTICLQHEKGEYILLNLNNAIQHTRSHHHGVEVLYACKVCSKTTKTNTPRTVTFQNAEGLPRTKTRISSVKYAIKPSKPTEDCLNMNIFTLQHRTKKVKRPQPTNPTAD